jgi:hypothetical protein
MAKFILPIEFVVEAVNEAEASTKGRELAAVLYQQHAVDYYLMGVPRPIEAPDPSQRAAAVASQAPQAAAAARRR